MICLLNRRILISLVFYNSPCDYAHDLPADSLGIYKGMQSGYPVGDLLWVCSMACMINDIVHQDALEGTVREFLAFHIRQDLMVVPIEFNFNFVML